MQKIDKKIFGMQLNSALYTKNCSNQEAADLLGVSPATISHWRNGESAPDWIQLMLLARHLKIPVNYFSGEYESTLEKRISSLEDKCETLSSQLDKCIGLIEAQKSDLRSPSNDAKEALPRNGNISHAHPNK